MTNEWEVIVVGGGISGLVAATELIDKATATPLKAKQNLVLVLEAAERLGGRTYTVPLKKHPDVRVDLGGQWINQQTQPHITRLVKKLDIKLLPQFHEGTKFLEDDEGKIGTYNGSIPSLPVFSLLDFQINALNRIHKHMNQVSLSHPAATSQNKQWDGMTVEDFKQKYLWSSKTKMFADMLVRSVMGAEAKELSYLYFLFYMRSGRGPLSLAEVENGAQQEKLVGGTNQISDKLAGLIHESGQGKVLLQHEVTAIVQDEEGVQVITSNNNRFRAKLVILAIPPTQTNRIHFTPNVPFEREQLSQRMYMGSITKMIITYKKTFWREKSLSGETLCANKDILNNPVAYTFDTSIHIKDNEYIPALVAFSAGRQSAVWSDRTVEELKAKTLQQLAKYFGNEVFEYEEFLVKDWNSDPFTRGCPVNHFPPGAMEWCHESLRKPFKRIHFAGTETATEWNGYMSGAVESGERAAQEVWWRLSGDSDWLEKTRNYYKNDVPSSKSSSSWIPIVSLIILMLAIVCCWVFVL